VPIQQALTRNPLSREVGHLHPQMPGVCHAHRVRNAQPDGCTVRATVNEAEAPPRHPQSAPLRKRPPAKRERTKSPLALREKGVTFRSPETLSIALPSAKAKFTTDISHLEARLIGKTGSSVVNRLDNCPPRWRIVATSFRAHPARDLLLHLWKAVTAYRELQQPHLPKHACPYHEPMALVLL
jgi:hypothetical protein